MTAPDDATTQAVERIKAAGGTPGGTFALLGWVDPFGQWYIAPLGTPAPDPDQPIEHNPLWMPARIDPQEGSR